MHFKRPVLVCALGLCASVGATTAAAQNPSGAARFSVDVASGLNQTINGNVNSGAIGVYKGQTTAILPQSYGDVYGTGIDLRFGGGFALNKDSEIRAMFIWQTSDADLVRLGDYGASSLYAQYSDYKSFGLDVGYRHYIPLPSLPIKVFAEATIGIADVNRINVQFAAPQAQLIATSNDFYDATASFTTSIGGGVLLPIASHVDFTAQLSLRHTGGLAPVDQFAGTGLETINDNSARLTVPIVVGVRFRFK